MLKSTRCRICLFIPFMCSSSSISVIPAQSGGSARIFELTHRRSIAEEKLVTTAEASSEYAQWVSEDVTRHRSSQVTKDAKNCAKDALPAQVSPSSSILPRRGGLEVSFRDVLFRYPERRHMAPVLDSMNLTVPAGQKIGIQGGSGCGKSTLFRLLSRLCEYWCIAFCS